MRDIRNDLTERLSAISAELDDLKRRETLLSSIQTNLRGLLEEEDRRFKDRTPLLIAAAESNSRDLDGTDLSRAIKLALQRAGNKPLMLEEFKTLLNGYNFGEKSPGRTIHWALVGMEQNGIVTSTLQEDGVKVWNLKGS